MFNSCSPVVPPMDYRTDTGPGSWSDSSGNFIETGSTCITHEGVQDTPTADLSYLPFTTELLGMKMGNMMHERI